MINLPAAAGGRCVFQGLYKCFQEAPVELWSRRKWSKPRSFLSSGQASVGADSSFLFAFFKFSFLVFHVGFTSGVIHFSSQSPKIRVSNLTACLPLVFPCACFVDIVVCVSVCGCVMRLCRCIYMCLEVRGHPRLSFLRHCPSCVG